LRLGEPSHIPFERLAHFRTNRPVVVARNHFEPARFINRDAERNVFESLAAE
jgi:hypothetical protein